MFCQVCLSFLASNKLIKCAATGCLLFKVKTLQSQVFMHPKQVLHYGQLLRSLWVHVPIKFYLAEQIAPWIPNKCGYISPLTVHLLPIRSKQKQQWPFGYFLSRLTQGRHV